MVYPRMRVAYGKSIQAGPPYKIYAKSQGKEFDLATILKDQVKLETKFFCLNLCCVWSPWSEFDTMDTQVWKKKNFENLKMFNTPGVSHLPILRQTNDGCICMASVGPPEI